MQLPSAIIFVNNEVTLSSLNTLATHTGIQINGLAPFTPTGSAVAGIDLQLQITETIWFEEFNRRVAADPNYPKIVHLNHDRILVILKDFQCITNRELADVVMFFKQGVVSVEKCKYGPPGFSLDAQRINIFNLLYGIKHSPGTVICFPCQPCDEIQFCHCGCGKPAGTCPGGFPPPICPPQTQTLENPRPPEHLCPRLPPGLGALELYGVEALEASQGPEEGAFGGKIGGGGDGEGGADTEV
jgi:hypothetical protein